MTTLSDKTKITWGVLLPLLGLGSWLTMIYWNGDANAKETLELKKRVTKLETLAIDFEVIKQDVRYIRQKIDHQ